MTSAFPLIGSGDEGSGIGSLSFLPTQSGGIGAGNEKYPATPIGVGQAMGAATRQAIGSAVKGTFLEDLFSGSTGNKYITGLVGLILIIAGVFLFRPVRETVVSGVKATGKVAALAA